MSPKTTSESELAAKIVTPTPALPKDSLSHFDPSPPDEVGGKNEARYEPVRTERRDEGRKGKQPTPDERPMVSRRFGSAAASIRARMPDSGGGVAENVFGGVFSPTVMSSEPDGESLEPHEVYVRVTDDATPKRDAGPVALAVAATSATAAPAAGSQTSPPESYFIAYGHCLLAGAGTGARDEAEEEASTWGRSCAGDFGGASGRARVSKKRRARGYGDALEVFRKACGVIHRRPFCSTGLP